MSEEKKLKKTKECWNCENMFDCKGKPEEVKRCINYKERKVDCDFGFNQYRG